MNIKITLLFTVGIIVNSIAQHNLDFDTTYTSLTEKTITKNILISDDNSIWMQMEHSDFIGGAWVVSNYIERRMDDNSISWQNPIISNSFYRFMGFDNDGNLYVNKGTDYLFRLSKANGTVLDSVLINGVGEANSIVKESDGGYIIGAIHQNWGWGRIIRTDQSFNILYTITLNVTILDFEISNDRIAIIVDPDTGDPSIRIYDKQTGLYLGQVTNSGYDRYLDIVNVNNQFFYTNSYNTGSTHKTSIRIINNDLSFTAINQRTNSGYDFNELLLSENDKLFVVYGNSYDYQKRYKIAKLDLNGVFTDSVLGLNMSENSFRSDLKNGNLIFTSMSFNADSILVETYDESLNLLVDYSAPGNNYSPILSSVSNTGCFVVAGNSQNFSVKNTHLLKFCTADASIFEETLTSFSIYPNPTNTTVNIQFENFESSADLKIINLSGQTVIAKKIDQLNSEKVMSIDVSNLKTGIYFVKIGNHTEKLIIE